MADRSRIVRMREERGAVVLYVAIIFLIILFMVTLIWEGAAVRGERRNAGDIAQRAGRIASQEIDVAATIASGDTTLDEPAAIAAAEAYIIANGGEATVTPRNGNEIVITVRLPVNLNVYPDRYVTATRVVGAVSD